MNNSKISVLLSCLLIISLCFSLVGCGGSSLEDSSSNDSLETDVIEEDIVMTDTVLYDEPISDDVIIDNLVYDDNVYECKINDNIICDIVLIDVVVGETTEEELAEQLPEEYKDYDIDWAAVIGKYAVGTAIIIAVGFIDYATQGQAAFIFGTPTTIAKDAFAGAIAGATINTAISCALDGKPTKQKLKKFAIEGSADGYMWGAIASATKNIISKQKLKFGNGEIAKIAKNGDVLNKKGEAIGKAFYKGDKIYFTNKNGVVKNVFNSSGKEVTNAVKKLPANSILQLDDSIKNYTDDDGIIYRVGDSLKKEIQYRIKGYKYATDKYGRIKTFATDNLKLKKTKNGRLNIVDTIETIAKGFQKAGDDRGHLFADIFDGDNSMANIIAMNGELNKGAYKSLENLWAEALRAGKKVKVSGELVYSGNSQRPEKVIVRYVIDNGDEIVKTFIN